MVLQTPERSLTAALAALVLCTGCRTPQASHPVSVEAAWEAPAQQVSAPFEPKFTLQETVIGPAADRDTMAVVDGVPIRRSRFVNMLIAGRGAGLLEEMIVHHKAKRVVKARGLVVTRADVEAEYDRSLRLLLSDSANSEPDPLRRKAAEGLLERILAERNVSRDEFMLAMERNAYLRRMVNTDLQFSDEQLRREYTLMFGEGVEIRHIQVPLRGQIQAVLDQLSAGADFGDLALRFSANPVGASRRGLLPSFTAGDPNLPAALREAAFALEVGQVSEPLLVDGQYHLIRVERRLEVEKVPFDDVRPQLEESLRERLVEEGMQELFLKLLSEAEITITDPVLGEAFERKYPERFPGR